MKKIKSNVGYIWDLLKFIPWKNRLRSNFKKIQLNLSKEKGSEYVVPIVDYRFFESFPNFIEVVSDSEFNGTSNGDWSVEDKRLVFKGRIGTENIEGMEEVPYCGFKIKLS